MISHCKNAEMTIIILRINKEIKKNRLANVFASSISYKYMQIKSVSVEGKAFSGLNLND